MSKMEFYKTPPRWHFLAALIGAVTIEVAAVAAASLAKGARIPMDNGLPEERHIETVLVDLPPDSTPPPPEDLPPPLPPPPVDTTEFVLTEPSSPPRTTTRPRPTVKAIVSRAAHASVGAPNLGSERTKMIFAPRPVYPFEARRAQQTGTGKFRLQFDSSGGVTEIETVQSTGSAILDQVSLRALGHWRCKPGVYDKVYVPITFTLRGAQL
jgi:TonB family protein